MIERLVFGAFLVLVMVVATAAVVESIQRLRATRHKRLAQRRLDQFQADYHAERVADLTRRRAELDVIARADDLHSQRWK